MPSISLPTALAVASAAGGVASAASGIMGASAAKSAGKTQAAAATNAVQLQQHMFDTIQQNLNPFMQVGQSAIPMIQGLLGVGGSVGAGTTGPGGPVMGGATDSGPGGPGATGGPTPGMLAAQAAGPHSKNPLTSGIGGAITGLGGGLGIGRKNASPLQDISAAMAKGIPISDVSWAKAGFGPGGAARGGAPGAPGAVAGPAAGGGNPLSATPFDPQSFLEKTPGYQFTKNQGLMATQNSYSSHGLTESGSALKGAANYAEDLAGTTYEARLGDYFKLLEGGQSAATGLGQFGTQAGLNMGQTAMSGAAATAAGTVGSTNALTGGITGVAGAAGNFAISQALNGTGMFNNGGGGAGSPQGFADTSGLGGFPAAYKG